MRHSISCALLTLVSILLLGWATPGSSQDDARAAEAQAHYNQGVQDAERGYSDERLIKALEALDRAIMLAPNWPDPYYSAAMVQVRLGRLRAAIVNLRTYLRLRPDAPNRAGVEGLIAELEAREPLAVNRDAMIEMLSTKNDSRKWRQVIEGNPLLKVMPNFTRRNNQLGIELGLGPSLDRQISLPEAGVPAFVFTLRIRGMIGPEPCPCDNMLNYRVTIVSKDEFQIRIRAVSNNVQTPYDDTATFTYRRVVRSPQP